MNLTKLSQAKFTVEDFLLVVAMLSIIAVTLLSAGCSTAQQASIASFNKKAVARVATDAEVGASAAAAGAGAETAAELQNGGKLDTSAIGAAAATQAAAALVNLDIARATAKPAATTSP